MDWSDIEFLLETLQMASAHGDAVAGFGGDLSKEIVIEQDLVNLVDIDEKLFVASDKIRPVFKDLERQGCRVFSLRGDKEDPGQIRFHILDFGRGDEFYAVRQQAWNLGEFGNDAVDG